MNLLKKIFGRGRRRQSFAPLEVNDPIPEVEEYNDADIGESGAVNEAHKWSLARKLVDNYAAWRDGFVPLLLMRLLDFRICSMIGYHLAVRIFDEGGYHFLHDHAELYDLLKISDDNTMMDKVIDTGVATTAVMPVKYRGYGHPVNSAVHVGHLFLINNSSFPSDSMLLGYRDSAGGAVAPVKGLRVMGEREGWTLVQLDNTLTDDLTAIFTTALKPGTIVEMCHFDGEADPTIIYRFLKK